MHCGQLSLSQRFESPWHHVLFSFHLQLSFTFNHSCIGQNKTPLLKAKQVNIHGVGVRKSRKENRSCQTVTIFQGLKYHPNVYRHVVMQNNNYPPAPLVSAELCHESFCTQHFKSIGAYRANIPTDHLHKSLIISLYKYRKSKNNPIGLMFSSSDGLQQTTGSDQEGEQFPGINVHNKLTTNRKLAQIAIFTFHVFL